MKDVDSFVNKSKELFPKLNCGLTTVYLKRVLGEGEIIQGKYKDENHTFLLIDKEIIVEYYQNNAYLNILSIHEHNCYRMNNHHQYLRILIIKR